MVKVNGEIITKTEFEARQVAELRNRPELAKASAGNAELQRAIAQIRHCGRHGCEFRLAIGDMLVNVIAKNPDTRMAAQHAA